MASQAKDTSRLAAMGGDTDSIINHQSPQSALSRILPSVVTGEDITLEPTALSSGDVEAQLAMKGAHLERIPFRYYRGATYQGKNRKLDNSDFLTGKAPLYDDLPQMEDTYRSVASLVSKMMNYYRPLQEKSLIASMELQDLPKVTAQQWKPTGWFLASPVTEAQVPQTLPAEALEVLEFVAVQVYGEVLTTTGLRDTSWQELTLMDSDPPDTMVGAPTYASGEKTHEARLVTLAALPSPLRYAPDEWLRRVQALGIQLGYPDGVIYSPVVSTRMGPMAHKKPTPLWVRHEGGYSASFISHGMYNRTRFVYPAPYYVNFLLSPLYVQMSGVRKSKLGLWHDPQSQSKYLEVLRKQGRQPYSIDFSGMDTGMYPVIIMAICSALRRAGFNQHALDHFMNMYPTMSVIMPDYYGDPNFCYKLSGPVRPWCSGFKLTSEFDTIYGASVILTALRRQRPTILQEWKDGKFVFLELGDDIMFTADFDIDSEKLSADAESLWGARLEIIKDAMFLKWFLPVADEIPKLSRSFARFIQQTVYNEDRYDGVEGGERPDAVMRLALLTRMQGLTNHPHFSMWWPETWQVISKLGFIRRSSDAFKLSYSQGKPVMQDGDEREILLFSLRQPAYFQGLIERAKFEPSAAAALQQMRDLGLSEALEPPSQEIRKLYLRNFCADPTPEDVQRLMHMTSMYAGM